MRFVVAVVICLISAVTLSGAFAQETNCRSISVSAASLLEQCGDKLNSWSLQLSDFKREARGDLHGRVWFECPIAPMCEGQPAISGFFVRSATWQNGAKDEKAIYEILRSVPMMAVSWSSVGRQPRPMPPLTCPLFDVSVGDMTGRGVCFGDAETKVGYVVAVVADDHIGFLLAFSQQDNSASTLKSKADELLPRFKIERATGDAGLMRWFR